MLEVGCGKGLFLERLLARLRRHRCRPHVRGREPGVTKAIFTPDVALHADGVILRHVLEHVPDPVAFLSQIRAANGGGGRIYIEVPCLDWICEHRAWFDIFYEHVNYFRLADLDSMFGTVHEAGHLFGGQYLYVVADLATCSSRRSDATAKSHRCQRTSSARWMP